MDILNSFQNRHIGVKLEDVKKMLEYLNCSSLDDLISKIIPKNIRIDKLDLPDRGLSEESYLKHISDLSLKNKVFKSYIGLGYYETITPAPIRRNLLENPGWYTQYTPYQAEISQGRLESLLNFQTMICDLTGMSIANASLLDEATAAAEAMLMFYNTINKRAVIASKFFVDEKCFPQTLAVLYTRAKALNIELVIDDYKSFNPQKDFFGALIQYPNSEGSIENYEDFVKNIHAMDRNVAVVADVLSLALLTPPGEWGADCVVGSTQRFGVPMGYGGPSAAYFAARESFKRHIPGRIIGMSTDRNNNPALRMALQTREQHIRRESATSNICTAQALLANMAAMYAVYHGAEGVLNIAKNIHKNTLALANELNSLGFQISHSCFFDTIHIQHSEAKSIYNEALKEKMNLYIKGNTIQISINETNNISDIEEIVSIFRKFKATKNAKTTFFIPKNLQRKSSFLEHKVFKKYHSETELMRYLKRLENKDLSLTHSMIPLGSCTMKLNATSELEAISNPNFANMHPYAPKNQAKGYIFIINQLEDLLCKITGFTACSLQPNSGAQGEFSGLLAIKAYHNKRNDLKRNIVLIPKSAHGTNPASAVMAGYKVLVIDCDKHGNIDILDLNKKIVEHGHLISSIMITYPSTHGVFEENIKEVIKKVHQCGGLVYIDGANMNAQVGLTSPAKIGADVCHLNLHKTFAIPHGGGGPGMGPICVNNKLKAFLPKNPFSFNKKNKIEAISAAPWGSASILLISYAYIKMLGASGLKKASEIAILNANYIKKRLEKHYPILYSGKAYKMVAHELIIDCRAFKYSLNIEVEDIAKRLIDYGFHAPTVSFPVSGTLMIEPTESESKEEIDRFCEALISIKKEIEAIASGTLDTEDNMLKNAPHTLLECSLNEWKHSYTREQAAFPSVYLKQNKFWASVARVNNSVGDRNLICTCPPIEMYET